MRYVYITANRKHGTIYTGQCADLCDSARMYPCDFSQSAYQIEFAQNG